MLSRRWCRCWRSAAISGLPALARRMTANIRSAYGMTKIAGRHQQRQEGREPVQRVVVRVGGQQGRVERVGAGDRAVGEQQAEQHRADVAHEDPGRVEVVRQEPDAHAGQQRRRHRGQRLRGAADGLDQRVGVHQERQRGHGHDAGREPVQAVDEVDGVHGDHHEQDGQGHAQVGLEREHPAVRRRQPGQRLAAPDQDAGRRHLRGQPADRAEPPPVVGEADHHYQAAGQQQAGLAPRPGGMERVLHEGEPAGDQQPGGEAAVHGQAAQQRGRLDVRVPRPRLMHRMGADRYPPHQRGEQVGHRRGDEKDQGVIAHAASASPGTVGCHQSHFMALATPRRAAHRWRGPPVRSRGDAGRPA